MATIRLVKKDKSINITNKDGSIKVVNNNKSVKVVNRKENIKLKHSGVGPMGAGLPIGGTTNQILAKKSNIDLDYKWEDQSAALVSSVNGKVGAVVLNKADVGLGNVDNTSDANKPVSTAVQSALNNKADDSSVVHNTGDETVAGNKTFTGTVVASNVSGTNTGDQDLSGLVPKTTLVNGHALSADVTVTKGDVGLGNADNTSDANKPISTATQTALDGKQATIGYTPEDAANKGVANGYASLDGGGKVPVTQLPNSIMEYQGTWNAATNTPTLADGTGHTGDVYRVSVSGTQDLGSGNISFLVSDYAIYNGSAWEKADTTDAVASVAGKTGVVTLDKTDVGLANVDNTSDATKNSAVATLTNKDLTSGTNTFPTLNQNTTGSAATLTTPRTIGTLTGDVIATGSSFNGSANNTNATVLATVNSNVGTFGSATQVPSITTNAKGLTTAASNVAIQIAESQVTNLTTDLAAKALDSNTVHKTGTETIGGSKTFSSGVTVGDGSLTTSVILNGNNYNGFTTNVYSDTASGYSFLNRFRGTNALPTQVLSGDFIGSFGFRAANASGIANSQDAVRFSAIAEEDIKSTSQKSALVFYTAPNNGIATNERMRISGSGNITIGALADQNSGFSVNRQQTYSAVGLVTTNATTTLTGVGTTFTNTFRVGDTITVTGETVRTITAIASDTSLTVSVAFSTTAVGVTYASTTATGLFRVQTNGNVGINQSNPQARLQFGAGTTAADGIQFGTDTTLYRSAASTLKTDNNIVVGTPGTATGSVATIDGTQTLSNKTLAGSTRVSNLLDTNGNLVASFNATPSAVNYLFAVNGATGNSVSLRAAGSDANIAYGFFSKGTGQVQMRSDLGFLFTATPVASPVNYVNVNAASTGNATSIGAVGSDTNVSLNITSQGTGVVNINSVPAVTTTGAQTLTNKTLTAPVINNPSGFLTGAAKITVGTTAPSSPTVGDLWVDTN